MLLESRVPRDGTRRFLYDVWQPLAILVPTFIFTIIFYATRTTDALTKPDAFFICNDNGYVEHTKYDYNPLWDPRLYFTINMAFGKFAFSQVKVIDAAWDAVIGRGGQVVAGLIAYRTLRRSLTRTVETCTLAIPTVTSLYCQQIQVFPVMQMTYNSLCWSWRDFNSPARRDPTFLGRLRPAAQVFTCVYVLLFATLVSVMTGYRAQLTGFMEVKAQSVPIIDLGIPRLVLLYGRKIDLPDSLVLGVDEIPYPSNANKTLGYEAVFDAKEFIESTRNFEEPYGTLVDYHFTCVAVKRWLLGSNKTTPAYELSCGAHNCSCSIPTHTASGEINWSQTNTTGRIVLNNESWDAVPFLGLQVFPGGFTWSNNIKTADSENNNLLNAVDYWSGKSLEVNDIRRQAHVTDVYMYGDSLLNTTTIESGGRCVVDDAYSWGFSSLLLLKFCCFTMLFALGLILLQTDVYWHSRHDRDHQSYSIYTDVIFLAEELKAAFGGDIKDHLRSPKLFRKQIESTKNAICLEVNTLPLSRSEEANPYRPPEEANSYRPRDGSLVQHEGRWVFVPHSETTRDQEQSTELEMIDHTSAVSSALSLQPETVDTNLQ